MSRTTITLPTELLEKLVPLVNAKTKTEAAVVAIEAEIRRRSVERIRAAAGKMEFSATAEELRHRDKRLG